MNRWSLCALAAVVSAALWVPSSSEACLHAIALSKDDAVAAVARADRLLARGQPMSAYRVSRSARRQLEQLAREDGRDPATSALVARARTITAIAVVRLDGRTPIAHRTARRHVTRGRAQRSLAWALEQLRARAAEDPRDLRARLHHAEALARLEAHRDRARTILMDLADRDLMPDPHGYAALLRLLEPGTERWQTALTRCQRMAADDAHRICPASSASSS